MRLLTICLSVLVLRACSNPRFQHPDAPEPAEPLSRAATMASSCSGCHVDGNAALVPLSGRSGDDILARLMEYKHAGGQTVMHRLARGYEDQDLAAISEYLAEENGGAND